MIIDSGKAEPISFISSSIIKALREKVLYCLRLFVVDNEPEQSINDSNDAFKVICEDIENLYNEELTLLTLKMAKTLSK